MKSIIQSKYIFSRKNSNARDNPGHNFYHFFVSVAVLNTVLFHLLFMLFVCF